MDLGNRNWQRYWCEGVVATTGAGARALTSSARMRSSPTTCSTRSLAGRWHAEDRPSSRMSRRVTSRRPVAEWPVAEGLSRLHQPGRPIFAAKGSASSQLRYMGRNPEYWQELDALAARPMPR